MNKREELKKKFEKLSPTDKIRYNLGSIRLLVSLGGIVNYIVGVFIISMFFLLPTIYSIYTKGQLLTGGIIILFFLFIASFVFFSKVIWNSQRKLEEFLNEKSKKK